MYKNLGNHLFLPEGDDYSKKEFDKDAEEIVSAGNSVLRELRIQQAAEQTARLKSAPQKTNTLHKNHDKEQKKMTYKEIFDEMAANK
ncbi:hypothetical protein [Aminipila luticellarii]|uniref:Uncharacterized protein n=1 Tax=Aminipila luticellarii TaxID=2507160 RepID=A0A410PY12_9FIRM|nr:hypothetical protein [Aminipila luticellarii]QAT43829.1 hypothetical protein EQM06_11690 [Aminipila luticellarii]